MTPAAGIDSAADAHTTLPAVVGKVIRSTRPWSFSMTAVSVALGTLAAARAGFTNWPLAALVLVGSICSHAATNLANDYFDFTTGLDTRESPTARYRHHPLVEGTLRPSQVLAGALAFWALSLGIGIGLGFARGWILAALAVLGTVAGFFYSAGPLRLKGTALGELTSFLMWGPVMILGALLAQTGRLLVSGTALLLSAAQGLWVAAVLLANNVKDVDYDNRFGLRTVAILLGRKRALALLASFLAVPYALVLFGVILGLLAPAALVVFLSAPLSVRLLATFFRASAEFPANADPATARAGLVFGILLIASFVPDLLR